jgi:gamma-glutamyltranspeptidase/glutathione hydrolase
MVAAPQVEAAFEGSEVLRRGGNAADALVTAALVQGIVDPHRCGIGGFGCATIWFRKDRSGSGPGRALSVDFHGRVGSRATPDQWAPIFIQPAEDGFGYLVEGRVNDVGYGALTVPGMLAGLGEIHERFGTVPWSDLVEHAAPYAERGFRVPKEIAEFWRRPGLCGRVSTYDRLSLTPAGRAICFRRAENGEPVRDEKGQLFPFQTNDLFIQRELAETYRRIAREGWRSFYSGALGDELGADLESNAASVTREDLARYSAQVREPLRGSFRGLEILTTPLPGGGVALLQALRLLEEHDVASLGHNSARYIDLVGHVLRVVSQDRLAEQGDPDFGAPSDEHFLGSEYIDRLRAATRATLRPVDTECPDTTHVSIVDADGNAVAFSHSLGYNSGVFVPGKGILYNNCMSGFHPLPGGIGSIVAGKARSTAIAETIVLRRGLPWLVIGSPGGARITAGLVQVLLNCIDFGMNVAEATVQPRFDGYAPQELALDARFPEPVLDRLRARGWNVKSSDKPFGSIGRVYAVEVEGDPPTRLVAGIDPGAAGGAYRVARDAGNRPAGRAR